MTYNWETTSPARTARKGFVGWILFVALAVLLFMLLHKPDQDYTTIPMSDFTQGLVAGRVDYVTVRGDELVGQFTKPEPIPGPSVPVKKFRVILPQQMSQNWDFLHWLIDHRQNARVTVENNTNLVTTVLVPLIPWLLIFLVIWFFVFRALRPRFAPPVIPQSPPSIPPPPTGGQS